MAESQSKIDAAAEKAFAQAAEKNAAPKKAADIAAKPAAAVPASPAAKAEVSGPSAAPAAKAEAKPAPEKPVARKAVARKAVAKKALAKKAVGRKAAAKKPAAKKAGSVATTLPLPTITDLKDKIMATTQTTATDFTAKVKETAAEMQTRARAAYDKSTAMTADVTAFQKGNFDALVESGKVLAAGMQDLGRTAVEDAKLAAETVTADVKALVAVKSPTELFQLQGEIARRNLDTIVARTSKNAEVMMKLASDMFAPLSTRASIAMERLTKVAA